MMEPTIRCDFDVSLEEYVGSDRMVVSAARVSTQASEASTSDVKGTSGLINYLMRNRHGTPFEHNSFTFLIRAPIFVWREFHRHRIGFSYNEESGRYRQLEPEFYVPAMSRPLIQVGKVGAYQFRPGTFEQAAAVTQELSHSYGVAYETYQRILDMGIAREVARDCLPVAIYSSCYVTCNARSLMSFLSLRTSDPDATYPSTPQWEIRRVAEQMEALWQKLMPITASAFMKHGRVSP